VPAPLARSAARSARSRGGRFGRLATLLLLLGSATPALAQGQTLAPRPRPQLSQTQQQKIFPEQRALVLQDHRQRIAILQQGERCLSAATNGDALRACMKQERNAYQKQRDDHRAAMRALLQRNGIQPPPSRMKAPVNGAAPTI
jgi:hypothetical protein